MSKKFHSRDHIFRPTGLSAALLAAGMIEQPHLVREPKREGLLRAKFDQFNDEPSVIVPIHSDVRPDRATWRSQQKVAA